MAGYGTDQGFTDWLTMNGHVLPENAPAPAILRQRGSQYIDGLYGSRFSGVPTGGFVQVDAWPRTGAQAYGQPIPNDMTPVAVEHAAYAAAHHEANFPGSLTVAVSQAGAVKRKKIGTIEKEFFEGSGDAVADGTLKLSAVEGLLAPFFSAPEIAVFVV